MDVNSTSIFKLFQTILIVYSVANYLAFFEEYIKNIQASRPSKAKSITF